VLKLRTILSNFRKRTEFDIWIGPFTFDISRFISDVDYGSAAELLQSCNNLLLLALLGKSSRLRSWSFGKLAAQNKAAHPQ
jgi:hypothetical protein